jgi:glyoxylase-like metal-dependent hydrolase (beta-lactamase superfamily II)
MSLEDREVLMVGDALATIDLVSGESGPRLLPRFVNDDHQQALASLHKLELVKAGWVLPGHGPPWEGSPQQAVKLAREIAAPEAMNTRRPTLPTARGVLRWA